MSDPSRPFDADLVEVFLAQYRDHLSTALSSISSKDLARAMEVVDATASAGGRIYSVGNGGSAAIADHLCCDWTKLTDADGHPPILSLSLVSNMPLYSAFANDIKFDEALSRQIRLYGRAGDLLVAISSSGNSENILRATAEAKAAGMTVIGMTGFSGGRLQEAADIALHVPFENYGVVEDTHQALMHVIAQALAARRQGKDI